MKNLLLSMSLALTFPVIAQDLPETFDLRDYNGENYVTSVKKPAGRYLLDAWRHGRHGRQPSDD